MKETFPNLKFVGMGAEQFANNEICENSLKGLETIRELGRKSGEAFRKHFGKGG